MTKTFTILFFTLSIASFSQIDKGLVGYWPMNGNANDFSGNENHGILTTQKSEIDRKGNIGCALRFGSTSSSDSVVIPFNQIFNNPTFSISLWYNLGDWYGLRPARLFSRSGTKLQFIGLQNIIYYENSFISYPAQTTLFSSWYHLVCVQDLNAFRIYFNNVLLHSGTNSSISAGQVPLVMGNLLYGILDDVRFYSKALTISEIDQLYNLPGSCNITTGLERQIDHDKTEKYLAKAFDLVGREISDLKSFSGPAIILYSDGSRSKIVK